jgi:hypothetical protein
MKKNEIELSDKELKDMMAWKKKMGWIPKDMTIKEFKEWIEEECSCCCDEEDVKERKKPKKKVIKKKTTKKGVKKK